MPLITVEKIGESEPVPLKAKNLMKARRNRPLLLIDLSVPRNIDPAVTTLDNVSLYNIDDLEAVARRGVQAREQELTACHQIVEAHVAALTEKLLTEEAKAPGDRPDSFQPAFLFHNQRSRNQRWHDVMFQVEI